LVYNQSRLPVNHSFSRNVCNNSERTESWDVLLVHGEQREMDLED